MRPAYKPLITAVVAIMTLAACSNDEPEATGRKETPEFTATIGGVKTRAYETNWDEDDEIGISGSGRSNVRHQTKDGDGKFTVEKQGEEIYFQDEKETTFTAYYPWNAMTTIKANTSDQSQQKQFDFLWAQATGKKEAPQVAFAFSHRMAKVVFTVKPGKGMSFDEVKEAKLSLEGIAHGGSFDAATGTATANSEEGKWTFPGGAPASFNEEYKTVTYTMILFPQVFTKNLAFVGELVSDNRSYSFKAEIDFKAANEGIDGASAKNELAAGRQYNLTMTLHKTEITMGECTINPWNSVNGDDIEVD